MPIRDLSDAELEEAKALADYLFKASGLRSAFASDCVGYAQNKIMTRAQFNKLKDMHRTPDVPKDRQPRRKLFLNGGRSKRPITLATLPGRSSP